MIAEHQGNITRRAVQAHHQNLSEEQINTLTLHDVINKSMETAGRRPTDQISYEQALRSAAVIVAELKPAIRASVKMPPVKAFVHQPEHRSNESTSRMTEMIPLNQLNNKSAEGNSHLKTLDQPN